MGHDLKPLTTGQRWLAIAGGVAFGALAALGAVGSFDAVREEAIRRGFDPELAWLVPVGVDVGIIALALADLLFTGLGMAMPALRVIMWVLTGATIWFNIESAHGDPVAAGMHAAMPILLVVWIEGVRHAVRRRTGMATGTLREGIPISRWFLAFAGTAVLWRRMVLWEETSYRRALDTELDRRQAIHKLKGVFGKRWKKDAPAHLVWLVTSGVRMDVALRQVGLLTALMGTGLSVEEAMRRVEEADRDRFREDEERGDRAAASPQALPAGTAATGASGARELPGAGDPAAALPPGGGVAPEPLAAEPQTRLMPERTAESVESAGTSQAAAAHAGTPGDAVTSPEPANTPRPDTDGSPAQARVGAGKPGPQPKRSDEELLAEMRQRWKPEDPPSREQIRRAFGVGASRATRLKNTFAAGSGRGAGTLSRRGKTRPQPQAARGHAGRPLARQPDRRPGADSRAGAGCRRPGRAVGVRGRAVGGPGMGSAGGPGLRAGANPRRWPRSITPGENMDPAPSPASPLDRLAVARAMAAALPVDATAGQAAASVEALSRLGPFTRARRAPQPAAATGPTSANQGPGPGE
ncbi:DUF2637 domain-containing protein [Bailinhaonella thermotolerans]|uniref:DUF2637 domain-containing protein n=1 Tax=Bailinhaonella thermotolerans TaxID=1070861 RepID=UPI00192A180A|nr:DUF2637 domain-containing protein [Bailinhaonella thermotolerans]